MNLPVQTCDLTSGSNPFLTAGTKTQIITAMPAHNTPFETILSNAQIILENEVVRGTLVLRDGKIAEIDLSGTSVTTGSVRCGGSG